MCTAISYKNEFFGRTFDYHKSFGERILITPRNFLQIGKEKNQYAMIGVGVKDGETPLYFDAMNERGLFAAALNFRGCALYGVQNGRGAGVSSSHFISFVLGYFKSVSELRDLEGELWITPEGVGGAEPTPLHWMVCDGSECIVIESTKDGLAFYDNDIGVLTNSPNFAFFKTRMQDFASLHPSNADNLMFDYEKNSNYPYSHSLGALGLPGDYSSVSRFAKAAFVSKYIRHVGSCIGGLAEGHSEKEATEAEDLKKGKINSFFRIMSSVSVPFGCSMGENNMPMLTFYTVCADPSEGKYYFNDYNCAEIRFVRFSEKYFNADRLISFDLYRAICFKEIGE